MPVPKTMAADRTLAVEVVAEPIPLGLEMTANQSMARRRSKHPLVMARVAAEVKEGV